MSLLTLVTISFRFTGRELLRCLRLKSSSPWTSVAALFTEFLICFMDEELGDSFVV